LESNQVDHERIVEAIMAGDGEAAQEAMRKHTSDQGDTLVRFIALNKLPHDGLQVAEMDLSYTSEDIRS
jgi:DNA-binding GntR family transcriptional regulator